jgi:hypothetical protein
LRQGQKPQTDFCVASPWSGREISNEAPVVLAERHARAMSELEAFASKFWIHYDRRLERPRDAEICLAERVGEAFFVERRQAQPRACLQGIEAEGGKGIVPCLYALGRPAITLSPQSPYPSRRRHITPVSLTKGVGQGFKLCAGLGEQQSL